MPKSIEELVEAHPFFDGLDPSLLGTVAGCGQNRTFEAESYLCREGEPADVFYIVRRGRVALEVAVPNRGSVIIDSAGVGDVVGASWLFPPYRWQFDARAIEPVGVVELDAECLRGKCDDDPELGYDLMKRFAAVFVQRMASARLRLLDLYGGNRVG
jgi:CRP/FNR family transcriptional regulator, cyclic AMP receptor protein